jgi:hypothetical protein
MSIEIVGADKLSKNFESNNYSVEIHMESDTVNQLRDNGFHLYAFRAVYGPSTGKSVVWVVDDDIQNNITITWTFQYGAFISSQSSAAGTIITNRTDKKTDLGQAFVVDSAGHVNVVPGTAGVITISNNYSKEYTCGISEYKDGVFNPLCASDLPPDVSCMITPIKKVALMFSTQVIEPATVIEVSVGPGIVIDLTDMNNRDVNFDIVSGWRPAIVDGTVQFGPGDQINPLLMFMPTDLLQ